MDVCRTAGGRAQGATGERRTAVDRAMQVRAVVDAPRYAQAERIALVSDNLKPTCLFTNFTGCDMTFMYKAALKKQYIAPILSTRQERVLTIHPGFPSFLCASH
jgi:hypothetical protein